MNYEPNTYYRRQDDADAAPDADQANSNSNSNTDGIVGMNNNHVQLQHHNLMDPQQDQKEEPTGTVFLLDVYETRQKYGYFSIAFSAAQTIILFVMMYQCGVAPITINPMVGPMPDVLNYWGAKNTPLIVEDGEHWRLLSPMMLHAGIFHLIGNVSVQLETGVFFEREWGSASWLVIYIASTLGASILSVCAMPGSLSVGSSGAVMGIFGAKLSEIFCRACEPSQTVQEKVGHAMRKHQLVLALGGVVLVMVFSFIPFVDWAAHLGGMLTGMTVGLIIFSFSIRSMVWRVLWFLVGLVLTVAGFAVSLQYMYSGDLEIVEELRDVCEYYQQNVEDYECSCTLSDDGGSGD